jgi:hypothetical protein
VTTLEQDRKELARRALEEVCARGDFANAEQFYSPSFRDHVNALEFEGCPGSVEKAMICASGRISTLWRPGADTLP